MSEDITSELRQYAGTLASECDAPALSLIADRIDRAHEEAVAKATAELSAGLPTFDEEVAELSDGYLADHGLVRLPVDADGKPWYVGDMRKCPDDDDGIAYLKLYHDGWQAGLARGGEVNPSEITHYTPTPAERIRAWVERARDDRADFRDLLGIADELEGSAE